MNEIILSVENVSKEYQLGTFSAGTFGGDITRFWYSLRGKEDPLKKVGVNDRSVRSDQEFVMALEDINFDVRRGEVLGIIGKNGAGKSTLLKLLSRITGPSTGRIRSRGRIGSLLEVGTGFHPELTGLENIYLNGAVLGMTKIEIKRKLDEIIEFSGCAQYIDTPVKRYSSGMRVRLGFAVAAFLEPEILIVDEVLAVGDFEFQKRAIGKMKDVAKGDGKTVLFVSHNMDSIKQLCTTGMVLDKGRQVFAGTSAEAIAYYSNMQIDLVKSELSRTWPTGEGPGNEFIKIISAEVSPLKGDKIALDSGIKMEFVFQNTKENANIGATLELLNESEQLVLHQGIPIALQNDSRNGKYRISACIQPEILNSGRYFINILWGENRRYVLYQHEGILAFEVVNEGRLNIGRALPGILSLDIQPQSLFLG